MDFLGLRNLTILDDAIKNIESNRGEEIDLDALSKDMTDPAAYKLLARGDTLGVFQLDGGGMRSLLRLMQPDNFEDISAALALYRPGPMGANAHTNFALRKNGKQPVDYIHPELTEALEPILKMTYGLIIYQEQVMEIAQKLAGYTLGNADLLRRAMGKKKKEVLDAEYVNFEAGMLDNGYSKESVETLWGILLPFSDYAFNKAHTAAYGVVSYWTAYLKANYRAEYMAALLTSVRDDKDKSALYLGECRRMGIKVLPPDVNESIGQFAARRRGGSPPSRTSCASARPWCATSAPSTPSSRPARSTTSATSARPWRACTRPTWTPWWGRRRNRSAVRSRSSPRSWASPTRVGPAGWAACRPSRTWSGTSRPSWPSSATCWVCTSRTTRCSASSTR